MKIPERRHWLRSVVCIVNFDQISHILCCFHSWFEQVNAGIIGNHKYINIFIYKSSEVVKKSINSRVTLNLLHHEMHSYERRIVNSVRNCFRLRFAGVSANIYLFKVNNRNNKKVLNMFRVHNKSTRTTLTLTLNK